MNFLKKFLTNRLEKKSSFSEQLCWVQNEKNSCNSHHSGFNFLAEWTGLEPATPGVTGRYSNQLNYHSW
jgi:hypothetical protein